MREVIITLISYGFDQKNYFLKDWPSFKFNYLGLALGNITSTKIEKNGFSKSLAHVIIQ